MESREKVIFVCSIILDNCNLARFQRAKVLTEHFHTAVICQEMKSDFIRERCQDIYRVKGKLFYYIYGILLIAYLRFMKNYRVIYTQNSLFAILWGYIAKYLFGFVWIYDLWDHPSLEFELKRSFVHRVKKLLFQKVLKKKLQYADLWVIGMQEGILDYMPSYCETTRIVKVTNGFDADCVNNIYRNNIDNKLEVKELKTVKICYAGWVTLERGISLIIEFLNSMDSKFNIKMTVFGRSNSATLKAIEKHNYGCARKIDYLGFIGHNDCLERIADADICLCLLDTKILNYRYAYAVKLLEYFAMGKIVIATDTPAMREIVIDGENGFLVQNDVESINRTFDRIMVLKREGGLTEIGEAARRTVVNYNWGDINRRMLSEMISFLDERKS